MSRRHVTEGLDRFAAGLEELVGTIPNECQEASAKAVTKSARKGAKNLRGKFTEGIGVHPWSKEYRSGFRSSVSKGLVTEGVVGNKSKPGLVHLLENGHATLNGRRTRKYPHMDPAFQEMKDDFVEELGKQVGEALR